MSSRIRGRRYRNIDPDERYGFVVGSPRPPAPSEPTIVAIDPSGGARDGTTVVMDDTAVTVEPGAVILQSQSVVLEPRVVTGPQQVEG